jgi:hypothetical protein
VPARRVLGGVQDAAIACTTIRLNVLCAVRLIQVLALVYDILGHKSSWCARAHVCSTATAFLLLGHKRARTFRQILRVEPAHGLSISAMPG